MLADPINANILYVGGDTTSVSPFTGNLARYNGSTWESIVNAQANGTAPHADSRNMVFSEGSILEVDDGGIYKLNNPDAASREWVSVTGDLRLFEFVSVAKRGRVVRRL